MQARVRFVRLPAQPSAEIVRVECAKCRRECDAPGCARNPLRRDRACRVREMQARVPMRPGARTQPSAEIVRVECAQCRRECDLSGCARNPLRRSCVSCARNAGESAMRPVPAQPSAEICACRVREMQARVRFVRCPRNPLRRSRVSSARNAGESAICPVRAQPSAEIARVECAKVQARVRFVRRTRNPLRRLVRVECARRRRECDLSGARATLCGDCAFLVQL